MLFFLAVRTTMNYINAHLLEIGHRGAILPKYETFINVYLKCQIIDAWYINKLIN